MKDIILTPKRIRCRISKWIAISQPSSQKNCICCGAEISQIGLICYLNHETFRTYSWLHPYCVKGIRPKRLNIQIVGVAKNDTITTNACGCSFCGKIDANLPMYALGNFLLHPKCIEKLAEALEKIFKKHGKDIAARLI